MPIKYINRNNNPIAGQGLQNAIFGYGSTVGGQVSMTNIVSNTGVVSNDITGVGSTREYPAAAGYGGDKAIFGYGTSTALGGFISITNLVSNTGVVANDTAGVGTQRRLLAAATYGSDKAIFGYGNAFDINNNQIEVSITNLVSNTGVVATDTSGVGSARKGLAAAGYGGDKAIFGYGNGAGIATVSTTNLVTNTGVVGNNVTGVGTVRYLLAAASYGGDKAIFGYGENSSYFSMTNRVSNTGVVSSDITGVGTARSQLAAAGYGGDKAIFGYGGGNATGYSVTNLISNTGVVATDTAGVGTARSGLAAASFSTTVPAAPKINLSNKLNNTTSSRIKWISNPIIITNGLTLKLDPNNASSYGGSGTTWFDISGNGANITLVNSPTYTSGTPSYFTFNGSNQYGTGATTNVLPQTTYTKFVWVYISSYADNNMISSNTGGHFLYMAGSNKIYSGHSNWGNYQAYASTGTLSLNTWYNIALTFSTTNGMTLYINGSLDSTYTANKAAHNGDGSTNIATFGGGNLLNGRVGEVLCYNRELTSAEVLFNYNYTKAKYGL